jgi:hypothetical protein
VLVVVLTANQQSIDGSVEVAEKVMKARSGLPFDRGRLPVLPVLSRFETRVEYDLSQSWLSKVSDSFEVFVSAWASKEIDTEAVVKFLRIPSIAYWSFGEEVPVISKGTNDPEDIGYAYENLTALLSRRLTGTETLAHYRDALVASARLAPTRLQNPTSSAYGDGGFKVFVSFAHEDQELANELITHLTPLRRSGLIQLWSDRATGPSSDWTRELDLRIEQADVILLLISPDYLASEYCYDVEMKRALEKHHSGTARVIPVILRPSAWSLAPVAELQTLPANGTPISTWKNRDEAFVNVTKSIQIAIQNPLEVQPDKTRKFWSVPLEQAAKNIWAARLESLESDSFVILSLQAGNPVEEIVSKVPYLAKVASLEFIFQLVQRALPGLTFRHLVVLPAGLARRFGAVYFSLSQSGPTWDDIVRTGTLAVYSPSELIEPKWELIVS